MMKCATPHFGLHGGDEKTHNSGVPIWGIVNQKGGVGKTTTAVNFAAGLAIRGKRVLLVDGDPQGNATTGFGLDKSQLKSTLFEVLSEFSEGTGSRESLGLAINNVNDGLDCLAATLDLAGAEPILMNAIGKEQILRDALKCLEGEYDWIIIDGPPSLGLLTVNILAASDAILVPMQCEFYALEGLSQLIKTVDLVRRRINPKLEIGKVVLTLHDPRNRLTLQVADEVRQYFGSKVAETVIPRNVRLSEAPGFGEAAVLLYPSSKGALAYMGLVDEVLAG